MKTTSSSSTTNHRGATCGTPSSEAVPSLPVRVPCARKARASASSIFLMIGTYDAQRAAEKVTDPPARRLDEPFLLVPATRPDQPGRPEAGLARSRQVLQAR